MWSAIVLVPSLEATGRANSSYLCQPLVSSCRHVILLVGWVAFAAVVRQASLIEADAALFDPYKILGLSVVSTRLASPSRPGTRVDMSHIHRDRVRRLSRSTTARCRSSCEFGSRPSTTAPPHCTSLTPASLLTATPTRSSSLTTRPKPTPTTCTSSSQRPTRRKHHFLC